MPLIRLHPRPLAPSRPASSLAESFQRRLGRPAHTCSRPRQQAALLSHIQRFHSQLFPKARPRECYPTSIRASLPAFVALIPFHASAGRETKYTRTHAGREGGRETFPRRSRAACRRRRRGPRTSPTRCGTCLPRPAPPSHTPVSETDVAAASDTCRLRASSARVSRRAHASCWSH